MPPNSSDASPPPYRGYPDTILPERLARVEANLEHMWRSIDQTTAMSKATADREQALANRARDTDIDIKLIKEEVQELVEKVTEIEGQHADYTRLLKIGKFAIIGGRWLIFASMAASFVMGKISWDQLKVFVPH